MSAAKVTGCYWSPTGYAYETVGGACSCRIAAPPGVVLYRGELAALEHEREVNIATVLNEQDRLDELADNVPPEYERLLAQANEKLAQRRPVE